ncbi:MULTISPECIES: amidophosphoribosyltransferase [Psychrilyobacter]|uniref:Amidophosphoribosyltransferase n=1 Tax=Psychrilyobacter piezotolerans TaxID=2293438 RepID=A0ABX9KDF1_9FUSO|nr:MULTISPECIES: amidophosphoribosyltransferase [Psychrilyobacter]MCS5422657.1 amidophosphoribosyltransferase [Psychrilyobacter sp. S5]NDI79186.1 amidophosphoribosyltransferase [Psychrilyobacter piezotolerans]RDE58889.1 amidophosphoribosyltransferase [Psychrilyobacter sp. S5]REI39399.1 amidophosphoribosyltransferase [Psychrilyobacter piezotolerans]
MVVYNESEKMEEECGVFGIYSKEDKKDIAGLIYYGLCALQHRGQESAGMSISKDEKIKTFKGMGLVSDVFSETTLKEAVGNVGIGHVRYSTAGGSCEENAQPLQSHCKLGNIAIAHNGNLINPKIIRELLEDAGVVFQTTTDSEVILNMIARRSKNGLKSTLVDTISAIKGSFALVIAVQNKLIGIRDPYGIRPLCMGKLEDGSIVLASESCALDSVGAELIRDINAGEIVIIDEDGVEAINYNEQSHKAPCSFEHIYFARPDSVIDGLDVYKSRYETGVKLWEQGKVEADIVIGVPDSGLPAAQGYAIASGIPFVTGLVKNKYIGRTFIKPSQELRERAVRVKLNPIRSMIEGKRVVVIDDSLVRGTTSKKLIEMLRGAGATEVHFRSASPAVMHPCYFGVDIAYRKELLAAEMSVEDICEYIGADSLDFLKLDNLTNTLGSKNFCMGCFNGIYPMSTVANM